MVQNIFETVSNYIIECKSQKDKGISVNSLIDSFFESLNNLLVYELYFEDEISKAGLSVISHLKDLIDISKLNSSSKKMEVILSQYERMNEKNHPVKNALFNMDTIELIGIIEGNK